MQALYFDGETYNPQLDHDRLKTLSERVFAFMLDGKWHSLAAIQAKCGGSEASISARLRDFRKPQFGKHEIKKKRLYPEDSGIWLYQLIPSWSREPMTFRLL